MPPATAGPYRLLRRLGAGGMGVVHLGQHRDGSLAAVKLLRPEYADDPLFRQRLGRELAAMIAVGAQCTARLLDSDLDGQPAWLASEYVEGLTLDLHVAQHGPVPEPAWWALAAGLLDALRAVHAAGVVHRDIKPSNIIVSSQGPKLIDFGIALVAEATSITRSGLALGTPAWMAPEQIDGSDARGGAADLFALGAVLAFAGHTRPPFGTGPTDALFFRIRNQQPDLNGLSAAQRDLCARLLSRDPAGRPTPSTALHQALAVATTSAAGDPDHLDALLADFTLLLPTATPTAARTRPTAEPAPAKGATPRRRRGLLLVGAAAAVATATGTTALALLPEAPIRARVSSQTSEAASPVAPARSSPTTPTSLSSHKATTAAPPRPDPTAQPTVDAPTQAQEPSAPAGAQQPTSSDELFQALLTAGPTAYSTTDISATKVEEFIYASPPKDAVGAVDITYGPSGLGSSTNVTADVFSTGAAARAAYEETYRNFSEFSDSTAPMYLTPDYLAAFCSTESDPSDGTSQLMCMAVIGPVTFQFLNATPDPDAADAVMQQLVDVAGQSGAR